MDGIMDGASMAVFNEMWHVKRHLDDPDYMEKLLYNLVESESDIIVGAAIAFRPNHFPQKGYWYEPYARQWDDTVSVTQIGSPEHDYFSREIYQTAIKGDTLKWNNPYMDNEGAQAMVSTYAIPISDEQGEPVAVLAIDISTEWISETVNSVKWHPSSFTMALTQEGKLIARAPDSLCSETKAHKIVEMINDSTVEKESKINGRATGFEFYDEEKGRSGRVYYARKRAEPKWVLVTVCYEDEAFGELNKMRKNVMWMALAGLLIVGLIVHLFSKNAGKLHETQMKQERIGNELQIARNIQIQMLPRESRIERNDIKVHGSLTPAREVGGDLYDFFIRNEKLFFCIGDVSGKGVPSAMVMSVTHSLFRSFSLTENNPAHILQNMNRISCQGNDSSMFVTLFLGVLDLPTGRLHCCNAGHDLPILLANGKIEQLKCKANLPLGVFEQTKYKEEEVMLPPSSTLFIYTDGLTEAKGHAGFFGLPRVKETLNQLWGNPAFSPQWLIEQITAEVNRFAEGVEQSDDLTMLAISYTPVQENNVLDKTIVLKNDVSQTDLLGAFIKEVTNELKMESKTARNMRLAVEEAVVNVMQYAYPPGVEGTVTIDAMSDGKRLKFVISDTGAAFDPTGAKQADTSLKAEERPIGGLGILLVRQLTDGVNYERIDGKNVLTIWKQIEN
jgi:sigma-B regulation protein RsbU (phosphoserine phosphatase)